MADRKGIARVSARALGGIVGIGIAAVAVAGATLLPLPDFAIGAPAQTVTPVPADQQRVCPGPLLQLAADAGEATRPSSVGPPSYDSAAVGADVRIRNLRSDADTSSSDEDPRVATVSTPSGATSLPLFAAAQSQEAAADDLSGLAAAACAEPSADTWLAAGSTALGQTTLVLLSNPSEVDATVDLTIYTETGMVSAPGAAGILVPAGSQKVIPLAGLVPSASAPVVRVQTTGGEVAASLQQSFEQGIQPRGAELVGATAAPDRQQIVPGVTIASMAAIQGEQSSESVGFDFPVVRLAVPGKADAKVTIGAVGETGTSVGNSYATTVKAGTVAEIPLDHLTDGNYTVTVNASVPVVAAVRTSVIGSTSRDFSWFVSAQALQKRLLVDVPQDGTATLHLANAGEADVTVTLQGAGEGAAPSTLTVPAEGGANLVLGPAAYRVSGAGGLRGSISFASDGGASSFALLPPGPLGSPITVYPN